MENGNRHSNNSSNDNSSVFYRILTDRLRILSFTSFQSLVLLWLSAKGYRDICVLKRTASRGRRKVGGADMLATSPYDHDMRVAVQIRFWKTPVQRRVVDELWGFMLRQGIPYGLIVTSSIFYPRTIKAALEFSGRPIRLISGPQLAGSLAALGLGVERRGARLQISESFFRTLSALRLAAILMTAQPLSGRLAIQPDRSTSLDTLSQSPSGQDPTHRFWWIIAATLLLILVLARLIGGSR